MSGTNILTTNAVRPIHFICHLLAVKTFWEKVNE